MIFTSLDLNLIGDAESLSELLQTLKNYRKTTIFGIATGRRLDDALSTLHQYKIPRPDVLITSQGTEIYYVPNLTEDTAWTHHINYKWNPQIVRDILKDTPGLDMQAKQHQSAFKIRHILLSNEQVVNVVFSFGQFLDILPIRASKGLALRWCAEQFGFPLKNTLVAGVTGADADMLRGNTLGTVVDNLHFAELSDLSNVENIYFSKKTNAAGILEALEHYHFFSDHDKTIA
jgi:sucrose-phosphate synthase